VVAAASTHELGGLKGRGLVFGPAQITEDANRALGDPLLSGQGAVTPTCHPTDLFLGLFEGSCVQRFDPAQRQARDVGPSESPWRQLESRTEIFVSPEMLHPAPPRNSLHVFILGGLRGGSTRKD
jgi:hypothetical protein